MSILFSFCDCHWILPWILPFILGLFFGSRFISNYRSRIRDLEENQLRESQRFAALQADAKGYKTELEENKLKIGADSGLGSSDKREYEQKIASLNQELSKTKQEGGNEDLLSLRSKITELEGELALEKGKQYEQQESLGVTSGLASNGSDDEAKNVEIDSLRSKVAELEQELANEKSKAQEITDNLTSGGDVVGESARSHSDMAELRQQLLSTQSELSLAKSKLQEQDVVHAKLDDTTENEQLRSKITALEADLALAKGKEYESTEADLEDPTTLDLRKRLLEAEGELALAKGREYESTEVRAEDAVTVALRKRLLETEAELALAKGKEYEGQESSSKESVDDLKQRILSLEADLALEKGKSYEIDEQNKLGAAAIILPQGGAKTKKKSDKKLAKQAKKAARKNKADKKKKQKSKATGTTRAEDKVKVSSSDKAKTPPSGKAKAAASGKTKSAPTGKTASNGKAKASPARKTPSNKADAPKLKGVKPSKQTKKKTPHSSTKTKKTPAETSGFRPAKDGKFSKVKEGDLTAIEGIGPKAAALLKKKGIKSWADLAAQSPGQLRELLSSQKGFAHVDPSTWTRQAKLAAGNHWTRLANLQDDLDGGKPVKKTKSRKTTSKSKASAPKSSTKKLSIKLNNSLKSDNFQLIEGVGPKMNTLLFKEGIKSWTDLASYSPGELRSLLDKHGDKYKIIDAKTWSKQASFASKGQWEKLIAFQKIDGSDSKAEKVLGKMGIIKALDTSDLKIVEGVGPKIESLLKKAGIKTLGDLAKASKTKLKKILENAGARYGLADPTHWAKQASLANAGKHAELKKLQDRI